MLLSKYWCLICHSKKNNNLQILNLLFEYSAYNWSIKIKCVLYVYIKICNVLIYIFTINLTQNIPGQQDFLIYVSYSSSLAVSNLPRSQDKYKDINKIIVILAVHHGILLVNLNNKYTAEMQTKSMYIQIGWTVWNLQNGACYPFLKNIK